MASSLHNLSVHDPEQIPSGAGKSFGIVVSEWNSVITMALLQGCVETLLKYEVAENDILVRFVPGTFELPMGALKLAEQNRFAGIVCIGCVIKGKPNMTSTSVMRQHRASCRWASICTFLWYLVC